MKSELSLVRTRSANKQNYQETIPLVSGIPIPKATRPSNFGVLRRTLMKAEVNQSFLFEAADPSHVRKMAKRLNMEVTVRQVEERLFRVWRTA